MPSVISRQAGLESNRFHSSRVNWKLFSAVSACPKMRVPRALHSSSHFIALSCPGMAMPCWSVKTASTFQMTGRPLSSASFSVSSWLAPMHWMKPRPTSRSTRAKESRSPSVIRFVIMSVPS